MGRRGVLSRVMVVVVLIAGCGDSGGSPAATTTGGVATSAADPAAFPPAPDDVSGMGDWLAAAYPGAAFLSRISQIEYVPGEVPGSGGFANAIVVTTDLSFPDEQALASELATALGEAHPAWATQYVIWFADGSNQLAGTIVDMTP